MKAIRVHQFGAPEVMQLEQVPDLKPGPGQVLVRIHAAGVNPVETYIRSGAYAAKPALPYTPGGDGAGTVLSVGSGVTRYKEGDRVYTAGSASGTYAEQALCTEAQVHPLPPQVTFGQGAAMGIPYGTAYRAMFQLAHVLPGETVFVHGATGGVGLACVQLGRACGATVIGSGGTEKGRKLAGDNGAHHMLDHTQPDYLDRLMSLTGGRGVDVVIEMLANKNLGRDLTLLAKKGRAMVVGSRGTVEINPRDAMSRDAKILGMTMMNASEEDLRGIHAALVAGLEDGTLRPVVGQELPLAEAARAHEAVMQSGAYGKIILVP